MIKQIFEPTPPLNRDGKAKPAFKAISLIELLHPDGVAVRPLVLGNRCPARLRPRALSGVRENADLILLAPTAKECRTGGWLNEAVQMIHQKLDSNGLAYVLAPPHWRSRIKNLLSNQGLLIDQPLVHLPDQEFSRYLVPLNRITAQYAFTKLLPLPKWGQLIASAIPFFVWGWLWHILPSTALVIRRPGARALFEWLFKLDPKADWPGSVIMKTSWRGEDGAVILFCFCNYGDSPSAVAKVYLTSLGQLCGEAENLDCLGPSARRAGAQVPQKLSLKHVNEHPVLMQTMIPGQSVATLLNSQPNRLYDFMQRLVSWLISWNRSTMIAQPFSREFLEQEILTLSTFLTPVLEQGNEYHDWLTQRLVGLAGISIPLVATHNDLTTWNLLLEKEHGLGVVDWEAASEKGLPFVDFFYAVTDALTTTYSSNDRLRAFQDCFASGGKHQDMVKQFLTDIRHILQVPDEVVGLCFHACWLHHAANEYRSTGPSEPRPFLQLLQWLSLNRAKLCQWVHG